MFAGLKDFFFGNGSASKSLARSRLHFVLVQDRTGLSPEDMASFKREMVQVLERYFVIDEQGFDISYKRDTDLTTLVINSPVIVRRQDAVGSQVGAKVKDQRAGKGGANSAQLANATGVGKGKQKSAGSEVKEGEATVSNG